MKCVNCGESKALCDSRRNMNAPCCRNCCHIPTLAHEHQRIEAIESVLAGVDAPVALRILDYVRSRVVQGVTS